MRNDAMTLRIVEQALAEQDELLRAATTQYAVNRTIALPPEALRHLREACRPRCPTASTSTLRAGIRC